MKIYKYKTNVIPVEENQQDLHARTEKDLLWVAFNIEHRTDFEYLRVLLRESGERKNKCL